MMRGGSAIISPLGKIHAGLDFSGQKIIYVELDTSDVIRGKYDFDVTDHCARPDVFQLNVDTRAKVPVQVK